MKIEVELLTKDPLYLLHDTNSISIGKRGKKQRTETKEDAKLFYIKQFTAEHSSIEWIDFRIVAENCRADIPSHLVRSTKGHPRFVVQSSRPDWNNGRERNPLDKTFVLFSSKWTPYSFIQMCRQRLCTRASKIDRDFIYAVLDIMEKHEDPFFNALAMCCVPNCVYRGFCPELKGCGYYERLQTENN